MNHSDNDSNHSNHLSIHMTIYCSNSIGGGGGGGGKGGCPAKLSKVLLNSVLCPAKLDLEVGKSARASFSRSFRLERNEEPAASSAAMPLLTI